MAPLTEECKTNFGPQFLQKAELYTPWYLSFRCLVIRERELKKSKNKVAIVRSAENRKIIVGPNEVINIGGNTERELDNGQAYVMFHESKESPFKDNLDLTPNVLNYKSGTRQRLTVNLSNLSTNTVVISPRAVLCELQPVTLEQELKAEEMKDPNQQVLNQVHVDSHQTLTPDQSKKVRKLLEKHIEIFSKNDIYI